MENGIYDENADGALMSTGDVSFLVFCFMQLLIFNREGANSPVYTVSLIVYTHLSVTEGTSGFVFNNS